MNLRKTLLITQNVINNIVENTIMSVNLYEYAMLFERENHTNSPHSSS